MNTSVVEGVDSPAYPGHAIAITLRKASVDPNRLSPPTVGAFSQICSENCDNGLYTHFGMEGGNEVSHDAVRSTAVLQNGRPYGRWMC